MGRHMLKLAAPLTKVMSSRSQDSFSGKNDPKPASPDLGFI